jgi:hypothetical protein
MRLYLIGYDLHYNDKDYTSLEGAIQNLGHSLHCLDSTWVLKSHFNATEICIFLEPYLEPDDNLLVVGVSDERECIGFDDTFKSWLKSNS